MICGWYFYASTVIEYVCCLDPEGKIPELFHGPYDHKYAATVAYREWKLEQMENNADEPD